MSGYTSSSVFGNHDVCDNRFLKSRQRSIGCYIYLIFFFPATIGNEEPLEVFS